MAIETRPDPAGNRPATPTVRRLLVVLLSTGLGLRMVQAIVSNHQGSFGLSSREGQGTTADEEHGDPLRC